MSVPVKTKVHDHWDDLLSAAVNEQRFGDFSLLEKGSELNIYLGGDHCRTLIIKRDGTWRLE